MRTLAKYKTINSIAILLVCVAVLLAVIHSVTYQQHSNLMSFTVTFDFLVTIPLVYYLLIRNTTISNKMISLVFTITLVLASFFISKENQYYLTIFKTWIFPLFEFIIIALLIKKVHLAIQKTKVNTTHNTDFFIHLQQILSDIVPQRLVIPFATELAVFYYGFVYWKKRKLAVNEFSYHKNSAIIPILTAFMISGIIELFVIHNLVKKWNEIVALILSILSAYAVLQIYSIIRAIPKRPVVLTANAIELSYSFLADATIPYDTIESICVYSKEIPKDGIIKHFSPFGKIEGNTVLITLKKEITYHSIYGIKRTFKNNVLYIDNREEFVAQVKQRVNSDE